MNTSGFYIFSTESSLNTIVYLYEHQFNPYDSIDNSLARSDDSCDFGPLRIIAYLKLNITYILIVTTQYAYVNRQGPFSLFVKGPYVVKIKQMSMYMSCLSYTLCQSYNFGNIFAQVITSTHNIGQSSTSANKCCSSYNFDTQHRRSLTSTIILCRSYCKCCIQL